MMLDRILYYIFLSTLLYLGLSLYIFFNEPYIVEYPRYSEPTTMELAQAHKYHGIYCSFQDTDREWYFLRDNKKNKLFTHLCIKNLHRRTK